MWSYEEIVADLKNRLKKERFAHTLRVMEMAQKLASFHGVCQEKARMAALLHDCGKLKNETLQKKAIEKYQLVLTPFMEQNFQLVHAPLGEQIARHRYGVTDKQILKAIRYHTAGHPKMDLLAKIIYVADVVEEGRQFDGVQTLRSMAFDHMDKACVACMDNTVMFLIQKGWMIDPVVIRARNACIQKIEEDIHEASYSNNCNRHGQ